MRTGDKVLPSEWDHRKFGTHIIPAKNLNLMNDSRLELFTMLERGQAKHWAPGEQMPYATYLFAAALAYQIGRRWAGGLVHHTMPLGWHQDRMAPPDTDNLTTVFRQDCTGGYLVVADDRTAYTLPEGWFAVFDNQEWHGVTDYKPTSERGFRMSLTIYLDRP